jgi:hypothetical protein
MLKSVPKAVCNIVRPSGLNVAESYCARVAPGFCDADAMYNTCSKMSHMLSRLKYIGCVLSQYSEFKPANISRCGGRPDASRSQSVCIRVKS